MNQTKYKINKRKNNKKNLFLSKLISSLIKRAYHLSKQKINKIFKIK